MLPFEKRIHDWYCRPGTNTPVRRLWQQQLARGAEPLTALLWGQWLHGEAGAALARKVGPVGFLARENHDEIPALLPR